MGAAIAVVAFGAGGVAVATELIAVGQPESDRLPRRAEQLPSSRYSVAVVARDSPLPWGVGVYSADGGARCVLAGQLRGSSLGVVRDGTFRPFAPDAAGACRKPGTRVASVDQRPIGGRYLVFGLAPRAASTVEVVERSGTVRTTRVSPEGAFLFVYDGETRSGDFRDVIVRDAAGRRLP